MMTYKRFKNGVLVHEQDVSVTIVARENPWAVLHKKESLTEEWLIEWEKTIPSVNCDCQKTWGEIKKDFPFQPSFEWTVNVHNAVNRKLQKPQMTLKEAILKWK